MLENKIIEKYNSNKDEIKLFYQTKAKFDRDKKIFIDSYKSAITYRVASIASGLFAIPSIMMAFSEVGNRDSYMDNLYIAAPIFFAVCSAGTYFISRNKYNKCKDLVDEIKKIENDPKLRKITKL
jgi:hypothetical protein